MKYVANCNSPLIKNEIGMNILNDIVSMIGATSMLTAIFTKESITPIRELMWVN